MRGYLYILTTKALPGLVKIGYTERDPNLRVAELSNTSIPHPFELVYEILVDKPYELEQAVHVSLVKKRESDSREFFRVELKEARAVVEHEIFSRGIKVFNEIDHERISLEGHLRAQRYQAKKKQIEENLAECEKLHESIAECDRLVEQVKNERLALSKEGKVPDWLQIVFYVWAALAWWGAVEKGDSGYRIFPNHNLRWEIEMMIIGGMLLGMVNMGIFFWEFLNVPSKSEIQAREKAFNDKLRGLSNEKWSLEARINGLKKAIEWAETSSA